MLGPLAPRRRLAGQPYGVSLGGRTLGPEPALLAAGDRHAHDRAHGEADHEEEHVREVHGSSVQGRSDRTAEGTPAAGKWWGSQRLDSRPVSLSIGIVGLPNVGKSTLFNALTKNDVLAANYPFATIEPNVGVVGVPDARLDVLAKVFGSAKVLPAAVSFVDIAGIVRGASEGEGMGNKFLSHIRESDAICQVTRVFDDPDVVHVDGRVSPVDDME